MAEYLELSVSHKDKNGKNRVTRVGVAFPSRNIEGGWNIQIDPGVSIASTGDNFVNLNPPRPKDFNSGGDAF